MIEFKIFDSTWVFEFVKFIPNEGNKTTLGQTFDASKKITMLENPDINPKYARQLLIHELTHAFIDELGFGSQSTWTNEQLAEFMAVNAERIIESAYEIEKEVK